MIIKRVQNIPRRVNLYNNDSLWNMIKKVQAILLLNGYDVSMSCIVELALHELLEHATDYDIVAEYEKYVEGMNYENNNLL